MKRILLGALGNIAALFAAGMDQAWVRPTYARQFGPRRQVRAAFKLTGRPTDKRHWHDRTEFYQSNALETAVLKRRRRAEKLKLQTLRAWNNTAHVVTHPAPEGSTYRAFIPTLNPFYVAK